MTKENNCTYYIKEILNVKKIIKDKKNYSFSVHFNMQFKNSLSPPRGTPTLQTTFHIQQTITKKNISNFCISQFFQLKKKQKKLVKKLLTFEQGRKSKKNKESA